ncbi:uroporphyrinogen decarboxylase (URO-D) [Oxobacter pfennigii]|uniref:Uroporphyrinogen decarboxylase (URO-D) n=1 Tax=Oxobacter pfennigii TaxID=36849 RepID=A0A0P8YGN8_9CLOT|nr:uroporphyrinogen decarboxylase family protein [Oxobacter pfennigii]KPU46205.1 uroporphyrinogen decarboxylase (URO-D) [Oxobacter pfennigii]
MLSAKENYLRLGRGEMPEYVPWWTMGGIWGAIDDSVPALMCNPSAPEISGTRPPMGPDGKPEVLEYTDMWGVPYIANEETGYQFIPRTWDFQLDDITQWHKVVKKPQVDVNSIDWEAMAKKDSARINRKTTAVLSGGGFGPFQHLVAHMGFTGALCALVEEPETVKEFLNWICDFYEPICEKVVEYYKPDIFYLLDDSCNKYQPFFSMEIYRDIFKPIYARMSKYAVNRGIPVQFHNCGRCEDQLEDMMDFGVVYWDPAQTGNDLLAIKEKYKGKLVVCGGFDFVPKDPANVGEEEIRSCVREALDKLAPGGGYAFCGMYLGRAAWREHAKQVNLWMQDEVNTYGKKFYK